MEKELQKLGFRKNESLIYLSLVELGSSSLTPIMKKTGLHKAIIYDNLEKLTKKGFIKYVIKANRREFEALSPNKILDAIKEQENNLKKQRQLANQIIPQLFNKRKVTKKQEASIYKGYKGLKAVMEEILNNKKEFLIFGAEGNFKELFGIYWENYNKRRIKAKILIRIIYSKKIKGKRKELKLAKVKYIPEEIKSPATTIIYDNTVAIIMWADEPYIFVMESKEINESYRNYFELLWKIAKK